MLNFLKFKRKENRILKLFFTGFAMGSADIVPGVSGGTIAFILGIYEELIDSIKTVSGEVVKLFIKGKWKTALQKVPFAFLVPLALGLFTAVLTMAQLLEFLLVNHPEQVWGFFFGLVLASIFIVAKRVEKWDFTIVAALILMIIAAYEIVGLVPQQTPATIPAFFVAGMIAICAMILPGISGSFILVLLGKYSQVLEAVNDRNFLILGVVMAGAVFGLALFSRVLSWAFKNYHNVVIAGLTGIMIGSLRKIWPWKEVLEVGIDSHGEEFPIRVVNILPQTFSSEVFLTITLAFLGIVIIVAVETIQNKKK